MKMSAILLAGGKGVRMGTPLPKQFLPLNNYPLALYSLDVLLQVKQIKQIIVVCAEEYRYFFAGMPVHFAHPGAQRQDSVYNGLRMVDLDIEWVCVHDAARPFITCSLVHTLLKVGKKVDAASLAMPVKNTLKEIKQTQEVARTLDRSLIWEIQTPQLLKKSTLLAGFDYAHTHGLQVTDDLSLAELVGHRVKLVRGSHQNIKITTPEDLSFAEWIIHKNTVCVSPTMEHATAAGKFSPMASLSKG